MQRLAPGVYTDAEGTLHFDAWEFCEANGYQPNSRNIAIAEDVMKETARQLHPAIKIIEEQD